MEITGTAEIPIPAAPALSASANVGLKIAGNAGFGSVWCGTKNTETESDGFVPMYRLKGFRSLLHGSPCGIKAVDEHEHAYVYP